MKNDPIVEEIRNYRIAHAAKYRNNLNKIFAAIKENEKKYQHKLFNREKKHIVAHSTKLMLSECEEQS